MSKHDESSTLPQPDINTLYRCRQCNVLWRRHDNDTWSLYSEKKPCFICDNSELFLQVIEPLSSLHRCERLHVRKFLWWSWTRRVEQHCWHVDKSIPLIPKGCLVVTENSNKHTIWKCCRCGKQKLTKPGNRL